MTTLANVFALPGFDLHADISSDELLQIMAKSTATHAPCPDCAVTSLHRHSSYRRTLADLPCSGRAVRVILHLRRFYCHTPGCGRATFVERVPALAAAYARRTLRLANVQQRLGVALGGEAGARLAARLSMPTSADTVLRLVRRTPLPRPPTPTVIGVDDWAKRKGHRYGTIICDLETHRPVDLLADRTSETFQRWLQSQPQIQVISRDRAGAYAEGARLGAPHAMQVADRFHLLVNLRTSVQDMLQRYAKTFRSPSGHGDDPEQQRGAPVENHAMRAPAAPPLQPQEQHRLQRRAHRHAQYDQMLQCWNDGWSQAQVAVQLGVSVRTIQRWLAKPTLRDRTPRPPTGSQLDHYRDLVIRRWQKGCGSGAELYRELQQHGYGGSYRLVNHYLQHLFPPTADEQRRRHLRRQTPQQAICTPHQATWLFLRDPQDLSEAEHRTLQRVQAAHPELDNLYAQVQQFRAVLQRREDGLFEQWVARVTQEGSPELRRFVTGLARDGAAVKAAMQEHWSNGITEGHIHRLKLVKSILLPSQVKPPLRHARIL